ncbi:MAG: ATP synthase F1 subunit gamma [Mycoplasmatales bacterium]
MATLIESKRRITSVKSTQKIIKAMEMVAASKVKKARDNAKSVEFFFDVSLDLMAHLYQYKEVRDKIFTMDNDKKTLIIGITSDMGLCGAYNANVNKELLQLYNTTEGKKELLILGKKGVNKLIYEGIEVDYRYVDQDQNDQMSLAQELSSIIIDKLNNGELKDIKIVYTKFVNPILQEVDVIDFSTLEEVLKNKIISKATIQVEPEPEEVFTSMLDMLLEAFIYSSILQSTASEHSFRRNSMEAANKNSLELIDKLNLEMNRIRQGMITQEISEIIGGSEALGGE